MPLPILEMACMHIEGNEGSVFIVPPTKRDQSSIIFGRSQAQATTSRESDDDLEPHNSFNTRDQHTAWWKEYSFNHGDGLNFDKGRRIPLQPFLPEGKSTNYYDRMHRGLGYITLPPPSESEFDKSLPSQLSDLSNWDSDISVGVVFKKLFVNMTSISQAKQDEDIEPFNADPSAQQLDLQCVTPRSLMYVSQYQYSIRRTKLIWSSW